MSATLTSGASGVSGKPINFTLNGTSVGSAVTNGSGVATLNNASLAGINAGSYSTGVGASFAGDNSFATSSGTASFTVNKATPTVTVSGGPFTYDATPHAATATAVGVDGVTAVSGTFAFTYTPPGNATAPTNAGTYNVSAAFTSTNANYSNATGSGSITIDKATPVFTGLAASQTINRGTASINVSGKFSTAGGLVPAGQTATVTVDSAPPATSSGFNQNNGNFNATVDTHAIVAGTYPITYSYAGDTNFNSATDSGTNLTVNNPAPTLTSISPTSGNTGQTLNVSFTGTNFISGVTTVSFGANITVNTVTVNSGTNLTANITIGSGGATGPRNVSVTNPAPGGGTATLANGFTVNNCTVNTTTSVASSLNPSMYGQSVTFTATVTAASGSNPPTGSLNFVIAGDRPGRRHGGVHDQHDRHMDIHDLSTERCDSHSVGLVCPHGNFVDSSTTTPVSQVVNKRPATWTTNANSKVYGENDPALSPAAQKRRDRRRASWRRIT